VSTVRPNDTGLIHYEPGPALRGYTLFCGGGDALLIDMEGRICHRWRHPLGLQYASLLPGGRLLARAATSENVKGQEGLNGQAPSVLELDWEGAELWRYDDDWLHHDQQRLSNGNTLLILWRRLTKELTKRVQGGYASEDDPDEMLADVLVEVSPSGEVVREWRSWEHLDFDEDVICPLEHRKEWTHCNSVSETRDGDWLVSFRRIDTVALIDPTTGAFKWKWGRGVLAHQHDAQQLANGHVTVFDNGAHRRGLEFSRALEVDPATGEIVWQWAPDPPFGFFSFMAGSVDRLANGNSLVCHSATGRLLEVTAGRAVVWEYVNPFFVHNPRLGGRHNITFRAHRYAPDAAEIAGRDLDPARFGNLNRLYAGS